MGLHSQSHSDEITPILGRQFKNIPQIRQLEGDELMDVLHMEHEMTKRGVMNDLGWGQAVIVGIMDDNEYKSFLEKYKERIENEEITVDRAENSHEVYVRNLATGPDIKMPGPHGL